MSAAPIPSAVIYYRVSTKRQGASGLGLEAQQETVRHYLHANPYNVLQAFTEVESGKKSNRMQLQAALALCRETGATLIIAKLDRLARNMAFVANLMETNVKLVCVDMPFADEFTLHIIAAVAQWEGKRISARTTDALARAKARGVQLGNRNATAQAKERALAMSPAIEAAYAAGAKSIREIAAACGKHPTQVARALKHLNP